MKNKAERGKIAIKSRVLGAKSEKIRGGNQTRKVKWCKMQEMVLKTDKL